MSEQDRSSYASLDPVSHEAAMVAVKDRLLDVFGLGSVTEVAGDVVAPDVVVMQDLEAARTLTEEGPGDNRVHVELVSLLVDAEGDTQVTLGKLRLDEGPALTDTPDASPVRGGVIALESRDDAPLFTGLREARKYIPAPEKHQVMRLAEPSVLRVHRPDAAVSNARSAVHE